MDNRNENTPDISTEAESFEPDRFPEMKRRSGAQRFAAAIFDIFEMFAICTAVILLLFSYGARLTVVEGASMEDTLFENDYLIVQGIGYTPTRGDIVVIQKIDAKSTFYDFSNPIIKRVIAVEGDTVDIDFNSWTVYVNGKAIDEPYANLEGLTTMPETEFPLTVEKDKIFVLGDHRNHSADSRRSEIGQVDVRCVVGRAILRVLPFEKIGVMERAKYE